MKTITLLTGLTLMFLGCVTKFSYMKAIKREDYGNFNPVKTDSTYELYVRQVVKVFDSANRVYVPGNGKVADGIELIEIEYLFISLTQKKAFVINNIASSRKIFYNSEDKKADLGVMADTLKIDIWYFSQFRFGTIAENGELAFYNIQKEGKDHIWKMVKINDNILKLDAISVADAFGEDIRKTGQALAFDILFEKAEMFEFVFKANNVNKNKNIPQEFVLTDQTFYTAQKNGKWSIIFSFNEPVQRHFKNVVFSSCRMYAAPMR